MTNKAICLVSGGMDSLVAAAIAAQENQLIFLHVNYGQKTYRKERSSFLQIADHYQAEKVEVNIDYFKEWGGNSLTDPSVEVTPYDPSKIPVSYVPFRNAHFIAMAVSLAEIKDVHAIYIGALINDSSGYPDCTPEFYKRYNSLLEVAVRPDIKIITPLMNMHKKDVILKAVQLHAPLHLTWSCYKDSEYACGVCDSCVLRLRAFQELHMVDPIQYAPSVSNT